MIETLDELRLIRNALGIAAAEVEHQADADQRDDPQLAAEGRQAAAQYRELGHRVEARIEAIKAAAGGPTSYTVTDPAKLGDYPMGSRPGPYCRSTTR